MLAKVQNMTKKNTVFNMQYVERASTPRSGDTHASGKMLSSAHDLFSLCLSIQHILCATRPISSPTKMRCVRAPMRVRAWDVHICHVHFFSSCVCVCVCACTEPPGFVVANTSRLHTRSQSSTFIFMNGELAQTTYTNFTVFVEDTVIVRDPPEQLKNGSFMFR